MVCSSEAVAQVGKIARALQELGCVGVIVGRLLKERGPRDVYMISSGQPGEIYRGK